MPILALPVDVLVVALGFDLKARDHHPAIVVKPELAALDLRTIDHIVDVALVDPAVLQCASIADAAGIVGNVFRELADLHVDQRIIGFLCAPQPGGEQERRAQRKFDHGHARAIAQQTA